MPRAKKTKTPAALTIKVYDITGREKGELELPKEIFNVDVNPKVLAQYVKVYLANQRQGTAATRTRGMVVGSTRKIYRQKGTGRARHGDIKAPIFVGGGIAHGPLPRDFSKKINKKQRRQALFAALSLKLKANDIAALSNDFLKVEPKTKVISQFLAKAGLNKNRLSIVLPKVERNNLVLASRNLENVQLLDAASLNAYEVLKGRKLLFLENALEVVKKHFLSK
jgi:large subunit ribosomal protein L4